ncbi:MAG: hypothetical protein AB7S26_24490 [Sandaracinaceae bacterium]
MRRLPSVVLVAIVLLAPLSTRAQERSLDVERFRPAPDRWGFIGIPGTRTPGEWGWNATMWLGYASEQLAVQRLSDGVTFPVLRHRASGDFIAQLGITSRVAVWIDAPVVFYQDVNPSPLDAGPAVSAVALRDPYLGMRVRVLGNDSPLSHERIEGEGLALALGATLPFGQEEALAGEGAPQLEGQAIFDFHFLDFAVAVNAGYRHRFGAPRLYGVLFENELFFGGAIQVPTILLANTSAIAEVRAVTGLDQDVFAEASTAVEGDLGVRWSEGDLSMSWVLGTGFNGGVGTPGFRGMFALELAPRTHDMDEDGRVDGEDQCPRLPEDRDDFEDDDGCPDLDNDGDLIPDDDDRCPLVAADFDHDEDQDGCTDPARDDDHDQVDDAVDECPDAPEDRDGFQDEDGCPDLDDDEDGVPDRQDRCRLVAEDRDGFEDDDGCPDLDNDSDGRGDADDACRDAAEDVDGFEDEDGCPDLDNDHDGVLDADDRCPNERETIDGVDDADGCPDTGGRPRWVGPSGQDELRGAIRFADDGTIRSLSLGAIDQLARLLLARMYEGDPTRRFRIEIPDGEAARVERLTQALTERSVPADRFEVGASAEVTGFSCRVRVVTP